MKGRLADTGASAAAALKDRPWRPGRGWRRLLPPTLATAATDEGAGALSSREEEDAAILDFGTL